MMCVAVKLASDNVGVAINESSKPFSPFIKKIFGRNVSNNMNKLTFQLRLLQLVLKPLKHFSRVGRISKQKEVKIILGLGI